MVIPGDASRERLHRGRQHTSEALDSQHWLMFTTSELRSATSYQRVAACRPSTDTVPSPVLGGRCVYFVWHRLARHDTVKADFSSGASSGSGSSFASARQSCPTSRR